MFSSNGTYKKSLVERAVEIALSQEGKCEIPKNSNWGEDVKTYLASVGIRFPAPWCMAFVYWCFEQAAKELAVKNPLFKTGGVLVQFEKSKKNAVRYNPKPGDIFIMRFGHGTGHTGIVESVDESFIYTIEGNTNDDGSREGYEVAKRKRAKTSVIGYLRFT